MEIKGLKGGLSKQSALLWIFWKNYHCC